MKVLNRIVAETGRGVGDWDEGDNVHAVRYAAQYVHEPCYWQRLSIMKVALVTGASRGLGAVICRSLAADGWNVAVNFASDIDGAAKVVADIEKIQGRAVLAQFDVTDEDAVSSGLQAISDTLGPVDLIVNNATGPQPEMPIMEQSWQAYLDQMVFFVRAPLLLLQGCLPDWRQRSSGRVINIGSEAAELGPANFGNYAAAKGAMLSLTRSWARELGREKITVNLVSPSWIPVERHANTTKEAKDQYLTNVPLGRFGVPQDVADAVVFLASERADFLTGQTLAVNGGRRFS